MAAAKRKGTPKPTWTSLVLDALVKADDFMTVPQLREAVKAPANGAGNGLVSATIFWLAKHRAVDSVEVDGRLWWFATPGDDRRTKHLLERVPEDCKRAPRKGRTVKPKEPT